MYWIRVWETRTGPKTGKVLNGVRQPMEKGQTEIEISNPIFLMYMQLRLTQVSGLVDIDHTAEQIWKTEIEIAKSL